MHREQAGRGFPSSSTATERRAPNRNDPNGYYAAFGLEPDATDQEVRRAYRFLAKRLHPDGLDPRPELFAVVQHIYSILGDPQRRHEYDSTPDGAAFVSDLEVRLAESRGRRLRAAPPRVTGWTYRADGDLVLPDGLYEALTTRAAALRVPRTWRLHIVPGHDLHTDGEWVFWGDRLPVTRTTLDAAISLALAF